MTPAPASVPATTERTRWPTVGLNVGGALLGNFDTTVRLDSANLGRGTEFSFEDDLGIGQSDQVVRVDAFWRITRHHRIDFSYFDIRRTSTGTIDREIQFGEVVFPINASISSFFETEIFKGAYRFTPFPQDTWEVGVSLGMHVMSIGTGLSANNLAASEEFEVAAPLPVVGLHGEWEFLRRLRLRGSTELFYVDVGTVGGADDLEGLLSDNVIALEWDITDNLGIGVGYNYFLLDGDVRKNALTLSGEYAYDGMLVYGRLFF